MMKYLAIPVEIDPRAFTITLNNFAEEGWELETIYYVPDGAYAILAYDNTATAIAEGLGAAIKTMIGDQT